VIEIGDRAHARKITEREDGPDDVAVSEFTVTAIDGTRYTGSPFGVIDIAEGWTIELARKDPSNLHLPTTATEILAHLYTGFDVVLIGKDDLWRNPEGLRVQVDQILSWEPTNA